MPELTCPNPECKPRIGFDVKRDDDEGKYYVYCWDCDMRGPYGEDEAEAIRLFLLLGEAKYRALAEKLAVAVAKADNAIRRMFGYNNIGLADGVLEELGLTAALADARKAGVLPAEGEMMLAKEKDDG